MTPFDPSLSCPSGQTFEGSKRASHLPQHSTCVSKLMAYLQLWWRTPTAPKRIADHPLRASILKIANVMWTDRLMSWKCFCEMDDKCRGFIYIYIYIFFEFALEPTSSMHLWTPQNHVNTSLDVANACLWIWWTYTGFISVFEVALEFKSLSADKVNANTLNLEPDKPMFSKQNS